ncbi:MAG: ABC transporter permease [Chloroflexi bacterium]|nr:ABC transporter permease [Chloroflexota bacterium]
MSTSSGVGDASDDLGAWRACPGEARDEALRLRSHWARVQTRWRDLKAGPLAFLQYRSALVGFWIVVFWIAIAVLAPVLAPHRPNAIVGKFNQTPSLVHLMGTDNLGRDVLSRLMFGSQPILTLAPLAVLCASIVGITLGLVAGYFGGILDDVLMRLLDATMAFPTLLLYMIIIAAVGPSRLNVILAITVGGFPGVARLVRSLVLDVRNREYVHAARLRGESALYIMFREILPNCLGPVIIDACLRVGYAAFAIGTLGFLGLGLPPPNPDWGRMVADGRIWMITAPWIAIFPALAISSLVVGLNLFADGVNAASRHF